MFGRDLYYQSDLDLRSADRDYDGAPVPAWGTTHNLIGSRVGDDFGDRHLPCIDVDLDCAVDNFDGQGSVYFALEGKGDLNVGDVRRVRKAFYKAGLGQHPDEYGSHVAHNGLHVTLTNDSRPWCRPSKTLGHNHLFFDKEVSHEDYARLLKRLVKLGIVEDGYYKAFLNHGQTFVRTDFPPAAPVIDFFFDDIVDAEPPCDGPCCDPSWDTPMSPPPPPFFPFVAPAAPWPGGWIVTNTTTTTSTESQHPLTDSF